MPHANFPPEVKTQEANNNLDIIDFDGRFYLVFRTAPDHFASAEATLYIVSTTDQKTWRFEGSLNMKSDLREPRFFVWQKTLSLYFAQLGTKSTSFEPGKMWRIEYKGPGKWSSPKTVFQPGFIPWRFKSHKGKPLLMGYDGGEHIYDFSGKPLHVYMMTTTDGKKWIPFDEKRPIVLTGGTSETDIAFDKEGNLYAVARNEAGDKEGFGSKICKAPADDLTRWTCQRDLKKYDSPLLFTYRGEIYLIGRRNVTETGHYDLQKDGLSYAKKLAQYQLDYWSQPKRCALWFLNRNTLKIKHLLDLPSRGDTCFASAVPRGDNRFLVYNYSSDINGPDHTWMKGQRNPTFIYSMFLTFNRYSKPTEI